MVSKYYLIFVYDKIIWNVIYLSFQISRLIFLTLISATLSQYTKPLFENPQQQQQYNAAPQREDYHRPKKVPSIISHKQSQTHDGNFKYAFHAENGLAQGEVISPDGTRSGGYTYIDPHGKKILVKYSAGKEGFRILESSDHIPKQLYNGYAPQPLGGGGGGGSGGVVSAGYSQNQQDSGNDQSGNSNSVEEKAYDEEPGKPYSFGSGYHFEFNG